MSDVYENLLWLPPAPSDFDDCILAANSGEDLKRLASYRLNDSQLIKISKRLEFLKHQNAHLKSLTPFSIGLISNSTSKLNVSAFVGTALRYGIALSVYEAPYNQVAQEAFDDKSSFSNAKLNAILIAIDYRGIPLVSSVGDEILGKASVDASVDYLKKVIDALQKKTGAQIIFQNIVPPVENLFGSFEISLPGTMAWMLRRINMRLEEFISERISLFDVVSLASTIGLEKWHNPTQWNIAKLSFSQKFTPIYADFFCRILSAKLGKSRRCLILDLDNTLWGGVIGDDGLDGILIGNGDPTGEAHLQIQKTSLELRERGIVLAVSSKNEESTALQPFLNHPDMILKQNHFAAFQANWADKASNIKRISEVLSLGLESMVFLDDNPAERMQVRNELPDVFVPELPIDPALFTRTLIAGGYFEATSFSEEDRKRASFYQANSARSSMLQSSLNLDEYLKSLAMEMNLSPFDKSGRSRIVQLISKSNQFNLTTKRYSEPEIEALEEDQNFFTRQVRLKDIFGDNGMISVVICKKSLQVWEIDTWLMSCRVLGRRVEEAVLAELASHASSCGVSRLVGKFIPTKRNEIVRGHYKNLGFSLQSDHEGIQEWALDISSYSPPNLPFKFV